MRDVRTLAGGRRPLAAAISFRIPWIRRIGRECDPVADQGVQETAVTEHGILSRPTEDEKARTRDFTGAAREWGARRA